VVSSLQHENSAAYTESVRENSLHYTFHCFENPFCDKIIAASREFLGVDFNLSLTGVSYKSSFLWKNNDYFVTQINLANKANLVIKLSDTAVNLILLNTLGKRQDENGFLSLKDITELEANILTAYNDFLYKRLSALFLNVKEINSVIHTLDNKKTIYLTFYIYKKDGEEAGKIILMFPKFIFRKITSLPEPKQLLNADFFSSCHVETGILIGKSLASLEDIKKLETDDIIILEKSNLHTMYLKEFEDISININPDSSLVIDFDDEENGDDIVNEEKNKDIWDSLEVDISACFEKIKVKLGDLREITEGLVVDVASVADNKVFLDVEGKQLASGELVIIGDKYGIRITEIFSEAKSAEVEKLEEQTLKTSGTMPQDSGDEEPAEKSSEDDNDDDENIEIDEDFDESDFEINDDDNDE